MPDTDPSATLAAIREDVEVTADVYNLDGTGKNSYPVSAAMIRHARVLLAALETALGFHGEHRGHCDGCSDAYGEPVEWPCDEFRAITTALTGTPKEGSDE
jgi:hypothetical protein